MGVYRDTYALIACLWVNNWNTQKRIVKQKRVTSYPSLGWSSWVGNSNNNVSLNAVKINENCENYVLRDDIVVATTGTSSGVFTLSFSTKFFYNS